MTATDDLADLPSPPRALAAVIRAARESDVSIDTLGKLVSADPSFAIRVLKVANSPIYGQRSRISSVRRAISVLGARSLRNIALCAATRACVSRERLGDFDLARFWQSSIQRASAARLIAAHDSGVDVDPSEAFTASLLQDLGVIALLMRRPEHARAWGDFSGLDPAPRRTKELELLGQTHDELASELSQAWGLPREISVPMRFHHDPARAPAQERTRAHLAHDAEILAAVLNSGDKKAAIANARAALEQRSTMETSLEELLTELPDDVQDAAHALGLEIEAQPSLKEILVDANRGLSELNLSYEEVLQRLEQALAEKEQLARELQARNRALEQLSLTDALTNLPNRRAFWGRSVYEINRIARNGETMCVVMADLDHFKSVNDTHGHDFGDRVLEAASQAFANAIRAADMVARIGGEEFAFILPGTDLEGALVAARKINASMRSVKLATPAGPEYTPTVSVGVARISGIHTAQFNADEIILRMLKSADGALYAAKDAGRDRVAHDPDPVPWN
ncbi:MAG: sensor domain-containing diguanylate cyclase [Nannocystaceae bacterium]